MAGGAETEVVTAIGMGCQLTDRVPFVIARRLEKQSNFISVFEPYAERPSVESVACLSLGPDHVRVRIVRGQGAAVVSLDVAKGEAMFVPE
jgi:hypothetical protein